MGKDLPVQRDMKVRYLDQGELSLSHALLHRVPGQQGDTLVVFQNPNEERRVAALQERGEAPVPGG